MLRKKVRKFSFSTAINPGIRNFEPMMRDAMMRSGLSHFVEIRRAGVEG